MDAVVVDKLKTIGASCLSVADQLDSDPADRDFLRAFFAAARTDLHAVERVLCSQPDAKDARP